MVDLHQLEALLKEHNAYKDQPFEETTHLIIAQIPALIARVRLLEDMKKELLDGVALCADFYDQYHSDDNKKQRALFDKYSKDSK